MTGPLLPSRCGIFQYVRRIHRGFSSIDAGPDAGPLCGAQWVPSCQRRAEGPTSATTRVERGFAPWGVPAKYLHLAPVLARLHLLSHMTDQLDRLATALADRYTIEREIGSGGMATVYLAQDLKLHRKVALKVLKPDLAAALGPDRFLQEIDIAAKLTHPHILGLHDCGEADGFLYYVMPYVEGESLRDKLARGGELPIAEAVRILRDVADALTHAHKHNVVHRDIKPDNVMLSDRHALVTDFGVAKAVSEATGRLKLTTEGVALGTPTYMSPEQAAADPHIDHRADVYALGVVAYELLTGRPPFTGTTQQAVLAAHLTEPAEPVTKHRESVSPALEQLVMRCLEKKPADRWQSTEELLPQLEALATPSGGMTPIETQPVRAAIPGLVVRRRVLGVGGAVLIVAAIIGAFLWPRADRAEQATSPSDRTAIAVLPFDNLNPDGPHAYFADGLHGELLTQLFKVAALTVRGRTSVMQYAGTAKSLPEIADELGVGSIVEGDVQVVGDRLQVNVRLLDAETGASLWAEGYNQTLDDAFAIQSDIVQQVVAAVGVALSSVEAGAIATAPTQNAEAYRLYLQGEEYRLRPGYERQNFEIAQQLYEQALALDSTFALAYASLAHVHGHLHWFGYDPYPTRLERLRAAAEEALRLAPDLPQAHWAMGLVHYRGERDYARALEELTVAAEGLPGSAELGEYVGFAHRRLGNWDEALARFEKATSLDPRDANLSYDLGGLTFLFLHRYQDAIRAFDRALELAPDHWPAQLQRARTYLWWRGELDTLRYVLQRGPEHYGNRGSRDLWEARLALWERKPDTLLMSLGAPEAVTFEAQYSYEPGLLYAAWAHQLRKDRPAATLAFTGALAQLDSVLQELPDDWRLHASRGLAAAGLGRQSQARQEADRLTRSTAYRGPFDRPLLSAARAMIFAQAGLVDEALAEIEPLLAGHSRTSVHLVRLDPRYDPIRDDPRFQALLEKYGN